MLSLLVISPSPTQLILGSVVLLFGLYYLCLPKPIPGIPYHRSIHYNPLGDLPTLLKWTAENGQDPFAWFAEQHTVLDSPVIQLFIKPFGRPSVFIADYWETEDILSRRGAEFDRSEFVKNLFWGPIRDSSAAMNTNAHFRTQRRLTTEVMSPTFLKEVALPKLHISVVRMIELWREKAELAKGKAWEAEKDILRAVYDGIWVAVFGSESTAIETQLQGLKKAGPEHAIMTDDAIEFPPVDDSMNYKVVLEVIQSLEHIIQSPLPKFHYWILMTFTDLRKAYQRRRSIFQELYAPALRTFTQKTDSKPQSALESVVIRNLEAAKKGQSVNDDAVRDELYMLLGAGLDTTATIMSWCVKYLALHQDMQKSVRQSTRKACGSQMPSASTILTANMPLVDAFVEELLRHMNVQPSQQREATTNTRIFGYSIPKGTEVFPIPNGASIILPAFHIDDKLRTTACLASKNRVNPWNEKDVAAFQPERWLKGEGDDVGFDAQAGPTLAFGLGLRGCLGKRFAYMQMRLLVVLLVLNFEFQPVPTRLADMKIRHKLMREPVHTYVVLKAL